MHNYLTRDDILPGDFIQASRKEAVKYGVKFLPSEVVNAEIFKDGGFAVYTDKKKVFFAKKLVLATGLRDNIPAIEGIHDFYGRSVFHCPYCDGWEIRDKRIGIYAKNKNGFELALSLATWSRDVCFLTGGRNYLGADEKKTLEAFNIPLITTPVIKMEGKNGQLSHLVLKDHRKIPLDAFFFVNGYTQQCDLVNGLGCTIGKQGVAMTNRLQETNVPGVYVAGDAARDMHFVVVAAAEGARAAVTINKALQMEERLLKIKQHDKATKTRSVLSAEKQK
jgi:thioredoxin reductase